MTLTTLPAELVEQVVSDLDYISARNLCYVMLTSSKYYGGDVGYVELKNICSDRTCVPRYIDQNFGNVKKLFVAMSKNYVYLSGSRSLEFFVPGIVGEDSDWDFYIPMRMPLIGNFMSRLEEIGVKWMTYEEEFKWRLKHCTPSFTIEREKIAYMRDHFVDADRVLDRSHDEIQGLLNEDTTHYEVRVQNDDIYIEPVDHMDYPETSGHRLVSGILTRGSRSMLVQLMGESRPQGETYIHSPFWYHSSCVQSFISPYVSCHLYGVITCMGLSHGWRNNIDHESEKHVPGVLSGQSIDTSKIPKWEKYTKRGFKYIDPTGEYMNLKIRKPNDRDAIWVDSEYDIGSPLDIKTIYRQSYANMIWHEKPYGPETLYPSVSSLYGSSSLNVHSWVTPGRCNESKAFARKYLPAGIDFIMRRQF